MSERREARARGPRMMGRGFGHPGMMPPPATSKDFRGSGLRLARRLGPEVPKLLVVLLCAVVSVAFTIVGPKILGNATDVLFEGVISQRLPAGVTQQQVIQGLRASGRDRFADLLSGMTVTPGAGVDFGRIERILATLAAVYVLGAVFSWIQGYVMAGVAQRTMYRLREDVDRKLARLPLRYFDDHPRGDLLSRVTNDIDNIANTLQQSLTQLVWAACTIVGVLVMMLLISPLLALISVVAVPLSFVVTVTIAKRSQRQFATQWAKTGDVDGFIEEMFTGHDIVKVFGKQPSAIATFDEQNEDLFRASFRAQFISGIIQPSMLFISNLNYVAIAVVGGIRVANGSMSLGDVVAFIQYARQFTQPITQTAAIANVLQSTVASAERVFELLDEAEEEPDPVEPEILTRTEGHITLSGVSFRYLPDAPLIEDLDVEVPPGTTVAIVGPTGAGKTTLVNLLLRFYEIDRGTISIDGV
ncbi:MAG: ABC transporter transmembrane domain-containing protein, partial [Candidatus Velamenicoccus archaeovorus]